MKARSEKVVLSSQENSYFQLAQKVFIEFARFEYCLKVSGFLKTQDGYAEPDWDAFSNCCQMKQLFNEIKSENATTCDKMRYIFEQPPKKQIVKKGCLMWDNTPPLVVSSQDYFGAVRRVRNNLFHGGKFNGEFFNPERSEKLLEAVLCVLKCAREHHTDIAEAYNQRSA